MHKLYLTSGLFLGCLAVAAGAFGSHALTGRISDSNLEIFETASRYHMAHAFALAILGLVADRWPETAWNGPGLLLLIGVVIFSGTLYALALTNVRWLGAVTPVGGVLLIAGWAWAAWLVFTRT